MQRSAVCVDANIIIKLVIPENQRPLALALWSSWLDEDRKIVAPRLLTYEVTSVLWRKVVRGFLSREEGRCALQAALALGVVYLDPPHISEGAFALAAHYQRPAAYDAHYLALAEHLACPFWTADERLWNAVRHEFPDIHWLGDFRPLT